MKVTQEVVERVGKRRRIKRSANESKDSQGEKPKAADVPFKVSFLNKDVFTLFYYFPILRSFILSSATGEAPSQIP